MKKTYKTRRERGGQSRLNQFSLGTPDVDMLVYKTEVISKDTGSPETTGEGGHP